MQVHTNRDILASPADVWAVGGDVANVARYVPAIESTRLEGDIRHAVFAGGGGEARERILWVDSDRHRYSYEYVDGPLALTKYVSTFSVEPHGDGSRVTWESELEASDAEEEQGLGETIRGIYSSALAELARLVEGHSHSGT